MTDEQIVAALEELADAFDTLVRESRHLWLSLQLANRLAAEFAVGALLSTVQGVGRVGVPEGLRRAASDLRRQAAA